jgi:hypothetical protein
MDRESLELYFIEDFANSLYKKENYLNITILNVAIATVPTAKGSYQVADVAYKNNSFQGKVEGKKVMSFGVTKDTFGVLSTAQPGQTFEVNVVKNDKGYNDWVSMQPANGAVPSVSAAGATAVASASKGSTPAPRSTYETPEERAQRQVLIVRQSSLSSAVATLAVGSKVVKPEEVLALAKRYNEWVFQKGADVQGPTGFDDLPDFPKELADEPQID